MGISRGIGVLLLAAALTVGTAAAATRSTTLPTWQNTYDWTKGGGYVGWHSQTTAADDYGMQAALGGNAGLWLWPLGGHKTYSTADEAEWTYTAPGTTRIATVQVAFAWSNKLLAHHCVDVGLRDAAGAVVTHRELCKPPPQSPLEITLSDPAGNPTAKVLYFRIHVDCGGAATCDKTIPSLDPTKNGAYARLTLADLTLVDDDAPVPAPSGPLYDLRGTYIDGSQTYGLTVAASDAGSGIVRAWLERHGYADPTGTLSSADASCDPTHQTPALDARICPAAFQYDTSVNTTTLAEGTSHFSEHAVDVAGNTGASAEWVVYIDRTGPSAPSGIVLSGFDPADNSGAVNFEQTSIDPNLPDGASGSGVAGYEARFDAGGGFGDWAAVDGNTFDVSGLTPGGTVAVEVRAFDAVGNRGAAASATLDVPAGEQTGDTVSDPDASAPASPEGDPTPDAVLPPGPDANSWDAPGVLRPAVAVNDGGGGGGSDVTLDRSAIVNYAEGHVGVPNTDQHGGAHPWSTNYVSFPNDCQNFVSQSLYAGGWPTNGDQFTYSPAYERAWWYVHNGGFPSADAYSYSWSAVIYFMRFVQAHPERGTFVSYWSQLRAGDVVQVDWQQGKFDHDGPKVAPTHSMVVTGLVHGAGGTLTDVLLTYHTTNRLNYSLKGLMRQYPKAVWWGIHLTNSF